MLREAPITIILIAASAVFSFMAFNNFALFERFKMNVAAVLRRKEYQRIISSGFLHVNITHLIVNMISLYYAGRALEGLFSVAFDFGWAWYLVLYFGSMVGGDLLALLLHRNDPGYSAVGASGAISGVLFALAVMFPDATVRLFFILPMPMWLFALLFVGYSLFGMRANRDNIGHEAHLGGALSGMLVISLLFPGQVLENWILVLILTVPSCLLIYLIYAHPLFLIDPLKFFKSKTGSSTASNPNYPHSNGRSSRESLKQDGLEVNMRAKLQQEMDTLLDKISRKGSDSLSPAERRRLNELSDYLSGRGGRAPEA